jgi:ornithine cyclodeaminase
MAGGYAQASNITAVGADDPTKCELDVSALQRARVFVDSVDTAVANRDIFRAIQDGAYTQGDLDGEIGEVLAGVKVGRTSDADITICKLVGIGAQYLAAAETSIAKLNVTFAESGGGVREQLA